MPHVGPAGGVGTQKPFGHTLLSDAGDVGLQGQSPPPRLPARRRREGPREAVCPPPRSCRARVWL